jgi:hypothetical protein
MSIVINGTGSISGLAVGGLPDGTVDSGTLATNSVDSAELIDGAVDDSHIAALAASKLTGALPAVSGASLTGISAGKVLQVVQSTSTTYTHPGTAYDDVSSSSITITPSATSSKILYIYNTGGFIDDAVRNCYIKLLRGSTIVREHNRWGYMDTSTHVPFPMHFMYLDSPSTTSAVTYKLQVKEQYAGSWEINDSSVTAGAVVIAMEIEG